MCHRSNWLLRHSITNSTRILQVNTHGINAMVTVPPTLCCERKSKTWWFSKQRDKEMKLRLVLSTGLRNESCIKYGYSNC